MSVASLLTASVLVTFVEAGSWSLALRAVQQNDLKNNNTLGPLSDVYGREVTYDKRYYQGSGTFWIPKLGCKATGLHYELSKSGVGLYNPEESITSTFTNAPFSISYGGGAAKIKGHFYSDFFTLGGIKRFENPINIGVAEELQRLDKGIMGLPSSEPAKERGVSIMHEAWRRKILDHPIFTLYLRHCPPSEDCDQDGFITLGGVDKKNCGDIEGHQFEIAGHWKFSVDRFRMGTVDESTPFKAIIDSGAPLIYAPTKVFLEILKRLKVNTNTSRYLVKCSTDVSITLTINGRDYVIPSRYLLKNLHNGYCQLMMGVSDKITTTWLIGVPFYKSYCMIHDIKQRKVSFAKIRDQL